MQDRQCPSCGGICKRHCERVDVPQRLSDEEIEECYWGDGYPDNPRCPKEFARAIEAKVRG